VRRNMGWVQLCGDSQVFDGFFKIASSLEEFISESVTAKKARWVFGNHLSKRIKIHTGPLVGVWRMIPLHGRREPDL
jgi:hypothetical protein